MTDREAMKMALEALETFKLAQNPIVPQSIYVLRQALAQPEQEPVAWLVRDCIDGSWYPCAFENPAGAIKGESKPLYTTPPSKHEHPLDIYERAYFAGKQDGVDETLAQPTKPWVGLHDDDFEYQPPQTVLSMKFAEAILRDKNK